MLLYVLGNIVEIKSNEELIKQIETGSQFEFVYFWGHQKPKRGVSKTCFSQWYLSPFTESGKEYLTAEHYMMYKKATLFGDKDTADKVLECKHPRDAKKLGREVSNYDDAQWNKERFNIVVNANLLKFSQHPEMLEVLLSTGNRILVEASPVDNIWGIGLASDNEKIGNLKMWKGLNLLGYALMSVRGQLSLQP